MLLSQLKKIFALSQRDLNFRSQPYCYDMYGCERVNFLLSTLASSFVNGDNRTNLKGNEILLVKYPHTQAY